MGTWRALDHTADLALEARGNSAPETLAALLRGLAAQVTAAERVAPREAVEVDVRGMDLPETLVTALNEVLYWVTVRGYVFGDFRVDQVSENRIRVTALGEPRDPARHDLDLEVKAATYHDLAFADEPDGSWRARVVFDV